MGLCFLFSSYLNDFQETFLYKIELQTQSYFLFDIYLSFAELNMQNCSVRIVNIAYCMMFNILFKSSMQRKMCSMQYSIEYTAHCVSTIVADLVDAFDMRKKGKAQEP